MAGFATRASFAGHPSHSATADHALTFNPDRGLAAFDQDPKAAQAFSATLAHQVMHLRTRIEQRNIRSARERVRHYLKLNADGCTVALRGTLKDLAAELGLTHEALYRTLAKLERSGEIKRAKGKITLARARKGG